MKVSIRNLLRVAVLLCLPVAAAQATTFNESIDFFRHAGASSTFFSKSYAYAVFPSVGSGALVIGGAFGKGRVYVHGRYVGDTKLAQLSAGFQAGGKAYSEIIFFEDKRALDQFESGTFEFAAGASVVVLEGRRARKRR